MIYLLLFLTIFLLNIAELRALYMGKEYRVEAGEVGVGYCPGLIRHLAQDGEGDPDGEKAQDDEAADGADDLTGRELHARLQLEERAEDDLGDQ
jgi:hypothetical protein